MASDEDERAWHPHEYHLATPSPRREGNSSGKQHLSSQNKKVLSILYEVGSDMHGHFRMGGMQTWYGVKAGRRLNARMAYIVGVAVSYQTPFWRAFRYLKLKGIEI